MFNEPLEKSAGYKLRLTLKITCSILEKVVGVELEPEIRNQEKLFVLVWF